MVTTANAKLMLQNDSCAVLPQAFVKIGQLFDFTGLKSFALVQAGMFCLKCLKSKPAKDTSSEQLRASFVPGFGELQFRSQLSSLLKIPKSVTFACEIQVINPRVWAVRSVGLFGTPTEYINLYLCLILLRLSAFPLRKKKIYIFDVPLKKNINT